MRTLDRVVVRADVARVFALASDVERWPEILPHYRWVRVLERRCGSSIVEMAAWRPFGPLRFPTWWVSEMWIEAPRRLIRYRHLRGVTAGMDVAWTVAGTDGSVDVAIIHAWTGPPVPLVGALAARAVIGPVFVRGIASRTLAGIKREAEAA